MKKLFLSSYRRLSSVPQPRDKSKVAKGPTLKEFLSKQQQLNLTGTDSSGDHQLLPQGAEAIIGLKFHIETFGK